MTSTELSRRLKKMYEDAGHRDSTTMVLLFGIKYAKELKSCGETMEKIARDASIGRTGRSSSYGTEINKGIRLARHVKMINS